MNIEYILQMFYIHFDVPIYIHEIDGWFILISLMGIEFKPNRYNIGVDVLYYGIKNSI